MFAMTVRRLRPLVAAAAVLVALVLATPASAQGIIEVPRSTAFTLENGSECAPNADVNVFFGLPEEGATRIGVTVSDETGHFSLPVTLPSTAPLGAGVVTVECGMTGSVLVYDLFVIEAEEFDVMEYAPIAGAVLGGIAVVGLLALLVKQRRERAPKVAEPEPEAAPKVALPVPDDEDDDPEYWFWDAETDRGPAKRLACLTDTDFYLHEVPADSFSALLETLAAMGPDAALSRAFFKVAILDIDEVQHHGTEIRVSYRTETGFVAKTIDLATELDEVIGFLSRRVPVIAATPAS